MNCGKLRFHAVLFIAMWVVVRPLVGAEPATVMAERGTLLFSESVGRPVKAATAKSLGEFARGPERRAQYLQKA